jgi:hypothetical protein
MKINSIIIKKVDRGNYKLLRCRWYRPESGVAQEK